MAALDPFMNAHPPVRAELPNAMCGWHLLGPRIFHLFLCPNHQVMSLTKPWRSQETKWVGCAANRGERVAGVGVVGPPHRL
jgi:hypothetical protein